MTTVPIDTVSTVAHMGLTGHSFVSTTTLPVILLNPPNPSKNLISPIPVSLPPLKQALSSLNEHF